MHRSVPRAILRAVFPDGLILGAAAVLALTSLRDVVQPYIDVFAIGTLVIGLVLALRFRRSRILLGLLIVVAAHAAMAWAGPLTTPLIAAIAILMPLDFALLAALPEQGLAAPPARFGAAILILQAVVGAAVLLWWPQGPATVMATTSTIDVPASPALLAAGAAAVATGASYIVQPQAVRRAFFWAIVAGAVGIAMPNGTSADLFLAAGQLILAVSTVEDAYALAFRDGLTGLASRRALNEAMIGLRGRYTVAMVDVDHFKAFNDRWGHDAGDQVLKMVARRLRDVGGGARVFRYGGEEFTVLFPGRRLEDARPALEALRKAVANTPFTVRGADRPERKPKNPERSTGRPTVTVTVSVGAAERHGRADAHEVLDAADQALYSAKKGGRNRLAT
ncbi:MAG: GGDEF domain-containing protein [Gemmatimonadota bacterium]